MNPGNKRYYGKVFGALLGFLVLRHPFGLLIGGLLGHALDAGWLRRAPRQKSLEDAHTVLDITPDASDEAVDAAYRRMMSKFHPDRVAGAGEEIRNLAEERAREINVAYDIIMDARRRAR